MLSPGKVTCRIADALEQTEQEPPLKFELWYDLLVWTSQTILKAQPECTDTREHQKEMLAGYVIENTKFPEAIREQKLEPRAMEPCASMAGAGYLVMAIC
ncbi:hypothetical protein Tco_0543124 [Tanacetum coccineum]